MDHIQSRQQIAADAEVAAQRAVQYGVEQPCPHPPGTEAHAVWAAAYARYVVLYSTGEASA